MKWFPLHFLCIAFASQLGPPANRPIFLTSDGGGYLEIPISAISAPEMENRQIFFSFRGGGCSGGGY